MDKNGCNLCQPSMGRNFDDYILPKKKNKTYVSSLTSLERDCLNVFSCLSAITNTVTCKNKRLLPNLFIPLILSHLNQLKHERKYPDGT